MYRASRHRAFQASTHFDILTTSVYSWIWPELNARTTSGIEESAVEARAPGEYLRNWLKVKPRFEIDRMNVLRPSIGNVATLARNFLKAYASWKRYCSTFEV